MATSNFYNRNASRIFAGGEHSDDCNMDCCDCGAEFEHEDVQGNIVGDWEGCIKVNESEDGLRSYSGNIFAEKRQKINIAGVDVYVRLQAIIRSGYYEGFNLDWELYIEVGGHEFDTAEDIHTYSLECDGLNPGMAKIQLKNVQKRVQKVTDTMVEELEKIYEQYTTKLEVVARFSNGETMYKKI